jgi:hypothetical protein
MPAKVQAFSAQRAGWQEIAAKLQEFPACLPETLLPEIERLYYCRNLLSDTPLPDKSLQKRRNFALLPMCDKKEGYL